MTRETKQACLIPLLRCNGRVVAVLLLSLGCALHLLVPLVLGSGAGSPALAVGNVAVLKGVVPSAEDSLHDTHCDWCWCGLVV